MDEFGLCEAIVDAVQRRAAGQPVARVRVRIGALHHPFDPALREAFADVAAGTVAEGAALDLDIVPVRLACGSCGEQQVLAAFRTECPVCGAESHITGGDELDLDSIQLAPPVGPTP